MLEAFFNTFSIAVPSTLIPLRPRVDGGVRLLVAELPVPGRPVPARRRAADDPRPGRVHPAAEAVRPTGLLNGYGAIWLAHTAFALPFGIFLLRNFFITLPRDLIEAARIDGASTVGIFRQIVVPLSVPAIAAYGIFQFLWVWNDLLMALVFVQRGRHVAG
jgi:alpha-glucoside transport system permease protein